MYAVQGGREEQEDSKRAGDAAGLEGSREGDRRGRRRTGWPSASIARSRSSPSTAESPGTSRRYARPWASSSTPTTRTGGRRSSALGHPLKRDTRPCYATRRSVNSSPGNRERCILNWIEAEEMISAGIVEGLNNKLKVTFRRAYGLKTFKATEIALYHTLGRLPEPEFTHRFF